MFRTLFTHIGLPYREVNREELWQNPPALLIHYGSENIDLPQNSFVIRIAAADYPEEVTGISSVNLKWMVPAESGDTGMPFPVPYLFSGDLPILPRVRFIDRQRKTPLISSDDKNIHCLADIIASSFFYLNLEDERRARQRDEYQRFHKRYSTVGEALYDWPAVDGYARLLGNFLQEAARGQQLDLPVQPRWPQGKQFALALSHDVDRLRTWTLAKIKRTLRNSNRSANIGNPFNAGWQILKSMSIPRNWTGNFAYIAELEKSFGAVSTFFIIAHPNMAMDPHYTLSSRRLRRGLAHLQSAGSHIGLHGTFLSAEDGNLLRFEKSRLENHLGQPITGNRQHYLRFTPGKTLDAIADAGFKYDSTLGFSDELGYRCGTSLPFRPYNPEKREAYPFREIPLILMDTVLLLESKLHLTSGEAWEVVEDHLKTAAQLGGCLTINWHNNNINPGDVTGYTALYKKILNWAQENNGWICSPDEVWEWWGERQNHP